jgi:prepilin peptidase CpaA
MLGNVTPLESGYLWMTATVVVPATFLASWIDYRQRRVPNWLNASLALTGLIVQTACFGWAGLGAGLAGMLVGLACLIVPWAMGGMGAGDVKLMGAIGAWFGPWLCLTAFVAGAMVGGVIAVMMILVQRKWSHAWVNMGVILMKMSRWETAFGEFGSARSFGKTSSLLPYGIPLTIGAWITLAAQMSGWWRVA